MAVTTETPLNGEAWAVVPKEQLTDEALHWLVKGLRERFPDKRWAVFASPVDLVPLTSLDAAWTLAQAACQERGVFLEELAAFNRQGQWQASAWEDKGDTPHTTATGSSPAAALLALAARLREPSSP